MYKRITYPGTGVPDDSLQIAYNNYLPLYAHKMILCHGDRAEKMDIIQKSKNKTLEYFRSNIRLMHYHLQYYVVQWDGHISECESFTDGVGMLNNVMTYSGTFYSVLKAALIFRGEDRLREVFEYILAKQSHRMFSIAADIATANDVHCFDIACMMLDVFKKDINCFTHTFERMKSVTSYGQLFISDLIRIKKSWFESLGPGIQLLMM